MRLKSIREIFESQNRSEILKTLWQFFKFGLVGISNTAVSLGVYYLFLWINPGLYMVGSIIGTILSIANAFVWNDLFVFTGNSRDAKSVLKRLGKTYISYGGTSILSNVLLWLEVTFLKASKTWAPVVNLLLTIPVNFMINKFWTFRKEGK